jgi:hypothetical protein
MEEGPAGAALQHVVVARRWKYAPPPWVLHDAVVNDSAKWLPLLTGEMSPAIASSNRPDTVLLKPWVRADVIAVELRIEPDGPGSVMTVLAYAESPELPDEARRHVRHRLGTIFGAALREWVDEPHW